MSRSPRSGPTDYSGTTYVVKGKTSNAAVALGALGADGYRIDGDAEDQAGWSLASGDVDGDRKPELVIGVPFHGPDGSLMAGSAYVLKGGALSGNIALASLRAGDYRIDGAKTQDGAGWSVADLARPQRRRHRRRPARRPGRGPPVRARRWRRPRTASARRSRSAPRTSSTAPRPRRTSTSAPSTGKGQLLMGGGGFRWGDQAGWNVAGLGDLAGNGVNVAAVGIPGWDSNQQTPVGTGRDRGLALLLNGVTDPIAPTITITSPLDGARSQGTPATLAFSCDDDKTVVSCTATDRATRSPTARLPTARRRRPAHDHRHRA